jgi:hypothetical protein
MARLHLTVEGPTEQAFAANVLRPHLQSCGVYVGRIELAAHAKKKGQTHRGGLQRYLPFRNDIVRRLKEDKSRDFFLSTMIDLYALPGDFPGTDALRGEPDPYRRVEGMECVLAKDVDDPRFLPYIQLFEFEAILLADSGKIATYYDGRVREIEELKCLAATVRSPELINDGQDTAPSKRIAALIPAYAGEKPTAGPIIAADIGLPTIRAKCPHFDAWLVRLEQLGQEPDRGAA